jgi:hypothetical protein
VTFVESRQPKEVLDHLREVRRYTVEEKWPGVYIIRGDILPIQIIDSRKLFEDENIWLRDLDNRLGVFEMRRITAEAFRQGKVKRIKTYLDVVTKANMKSLQEVVRMSDGVLTLDKIFEEAGLVAIWEARGEARGKAIGEARGEARGEKKKAMEIAKNLLDNGFSVEQTAKLSGLDVIAVKELCG